MITANINVTRIDKAHLIDGKNGKYLDLVLFENKDGKDKYGNDGFVVQGLPKEARDRGEKGPIIGNWRNLDARGGSRSSSPATTAPVATQRPQRPGGTRF